MVRWLKGGHDSPARGMTLHTLRWRSSKYALYVASLTRNLRVAATEREASTAVIKFDIGATGTRLSLYLARQHEAKAQDQRAQNRPDQPQLMQLTTESANVHFHPQIFIHSRTVPPCSYISLGI